MHTREDSGHRTLQDYVGLLRRRKWIALIPILIVPVAAYVYSARQPSVYASTAEVLLSRQDLGSTLSGSTNADIYTDPDRFAQTQAALARVPEVARRAVEKAGATMTADALLGASFVSPRGNADILQFTVESSRPRTAAQLAGAYAQAFSEYRLELDTASLAAARTDLQRSIATLRREGAADTQLYSDLTRKSQELRTMELLQRRPAVVRAPTDGEKIAPTPRRNAALGVFVGVLLGLAIALVWDALDKRVRDVDEIVASLGLLLLGRVSTPRQSAEGSELPMLREPAARDAESFRRLRSNFEFANLDVKAKVVMITSAVGDEGKSQTLANLAIALARGGRRVALVDLDLRKPTLARYFRLELRPGITDVVIGRIRLDQGLVQIPLDVDENGVSTSPAARARAEAGSAGIRSFPGQRSGFDGGVGELAVLPAGFPPANPGEFVGTQAVAGILTQLRDEMDLVLVDAPPLLPVSDAAALSKHVDAMLVVARLGLVNRPMLKELSRDIAACPAYKLGLIITGGDAPEHYGETYGHGTSATSREPQHIAIPLRGAPVVAAEEVLPALEEQRSSTSHPR